MQPDDYVVFRRVLLGLLENESVDGEKLWSIYIIRLEFDPHVVAGVFFLLLNL